MKTNRTKPLILIDVLFVLFVCVTAATAQSAFFRWELSEMQPNIPNGGRANTFAVHPTNINNIYVTSETGGLFRSTNGGVTWRHVDALPCYRTMSVSYLRANPNIVLVTTDDDFRTASGGGIWRSTDGGFSWTMSTVTIPGSITNGRLKGFEISVAPDNGDIYVGSSYGVLKSIDQGGNWTHHDVFGGGDRSVQSVVALGSNRVIAGGASGVRRSETGGNAWVSPTTSPGGVWDLHALGSSPLSNMQAFVVSGSTQLFHTEDAGATWTPVTSAPLGGGVCGGISFARAVNRTVVRGSTKTPRLDLYFGNRCNISKLRVTRNILTGAYDFSGTWQTLNIDHGDTRDIAFDNATNATPILLGTDGGLHKTLDGGANWTFTGGGVNGYNALQITEVQGQLIQNINRFDFYFGTQDNDLWSSSTNGATWIRGMCCEGFFIEAQKRVPAAFNSKVTNVRCGGCTNTVSDPLFTNVGDWTNPDGDVVGNPMIIGESQHIQGVNTSGGFSSGLAFTDKLGKSWRQYAIFPENRRDIPKLGRSSTALRSTVVYQSYRVPGWMPDDFEIDYLMRITKSPLSLTATVIYPAMNNFGGLGILPTMFAWYQVYAVDPGNYLHVIAPDIVNERMMETRDGGENWTEIPGLTNLVTDGGRLLFRTGNFSLVSVISFSPQNPNIVSLGTIEGGLYLSTDNGANWFRVPNSEVVTTTTGFAWKNAGDVVISTYGRGLWRLQGVFRVPRVEFERYCEAPCLVRVWPWQRIVQPEERVTFDRGVLVFEGKIMGATVANRVVKELFVSDGSSVVFVGENTERSDIKVTFTNKEMGFRGAPNSPRAPAANGLMKGLVFDRENRLQGAVFGDKPMMMFADKNIEDKEGSTQSRSAGKPYIQLSTRRFQGAPVALPNEVMRITVTDLERNTEIVIYIDNKAVTRVRANEQGRVQAEVRAPQEFGRHSLTIRAASNEKRVIDGTMFLVKHEDNFPRRRGQ